MALLQFNAAQVEPQKSNFDPLPAGNYVAQVVESDIKPTKSGQALNLTFEVLDGAHRNRKVWARLNIKNDSAKAQEIAQAQLSALCHAIGVINLTDTHQLHAKPVRIRVKVRPADGNYAASNDVTGFEAVPGGAVPAAAPAFAAAPAAAPAKAAPWARAA